MNRIVALAAVVVVLLVPPPCAHVLAAGDFMVLRSDEATVADIHAAINAGELTCRALVQQYLDRIAAYDKQGPTLNAIIAVNPSALKVAGELDAAFGRSGFAGPLHCIPVIVKDNFDTADMSTTAGSLALEGFVPSRDAFLVRRIREAGGIVLAKSNMAELAFSAWETVNSILPGHTRNPYALDRVPGGSSGGTAAAVAASFGAVGLGTDTGASIRGPSSHAALVGLRPTIGLTSRAGIVPVNSRDVGGPMTRTVADAAAVLDAIAGPDPDDPTTEASRGRPPASYTAFLRRDGLQGARLGVFRFLIDQKTADPEVLQLFERALADLKRQGAEVVDPVAIPDYDKLPRSGGTGCGDGVKFFLNKYLASHGPQAPVKSLAEIIESRKFHPSIERRLLTAQAAELPPDEDPKCAGMWERYRALQNRILKLVADERLDAFVYPTWSNPPRVIGDLNTPPGNNNPQLSPPTGFPAITVPMGFTRGTLPAGLQFLGPAWSEPRLITLAYAYEQATRHRRPPSSVPPLASRSGS